MTSAPTSLQARIFEIWARAMLRHRAVVLLLVAAITVALGWRAATLPILTTLGDMLPEDTPGLVSYQEARDRFGGDEAVFLGLEADDHFTAAGLTRLIELTEALEAHPFVERVISPVTMDELRPDTEDPEGGLIVAPYIREGRTPVEVGEALRADEAKLGNVVSPDGRMVMIIAQLIPNTDEWAGSADLAPEIDLRVAGIPGLDPATAGADAARRRLELAKQISAAELTAAAVEAGFALDHVHAGGFNVILFFLVEAGARNMQVLFPLTSFVLLLALWWLMRRPLDAILPLLCVGPAVIWALGLGGMVFDRLSIISTISPIMVLVVGVSDVVHLVTQYRHELARGRERDDAIVVSFQHVGAACTLTSLTTFVGFGAMWFLPLPPSRELGVFAGLGVVSAFLLSFTLTPILLSFASTGITKAPARKADARMTSLLTWLANFVAPRTKIITIVGIAFTVLVAGAVLQVEVENGLLRKFRRDHPIRQSLVKMEEALGGGSQLEVLIDSGRPGGLKDPRLLAGLDEVFRRAAEEPGVGGTTSYVDLIARMHEILGPTDGTASPLPTQSALVAQYLLLFELQGGDDIEPLVDHDLEHARGTILLGDVTAEEAIALADRIDAWGAELLPAGASLETSGLGLLAARFGPRAKVSVLGGFAKAMLLIALLLGLLFRSLKVGLISLVPNVLPVAFGVSMVSLLYEQVDLDTLNFLAICLGIAVDDTIHFLVRFRIERAKGLAREAAVQITILEAGHGIVRTSVVLVAGFAVMVAADYMPISSGGMVLCATLVSAVIVDLTLVPAMAQQRLLD